MDKVFLFGPMILTNNWSFRTNILNISLDRHFPYSHDIVMGIRSVSHTTLMCIYWGHMYIFISNMRFLSLILWLGGLCTDANADNADNTDTDEDNNYARRTIHDHVGSFCIIPNEPKKQEQFVNYILKFNPH